MAKDSVMARKICVISGSRADNSPLSHLISILHHDSRCEFQYIETSGIYGNEAHIISELSLLSPDILVALGDRTETALACVVAASMAIPIAHIQGGEITEGCTDENMRHCLTKLAYYHFPIHQMYANRLIQMGESPDRIFVCGAPGVDNLAMPRMTRAEIEMELGIDLKQFALVCFHPETLGNQPEITLGIMAQYHLIICGANADPGGAAMTLMAQQLLGQQNGAYYRETYGARVWTNLMREADVLIGNSSSFIFEGMTLGKKVINVGDRQKGRYEDAVKLFSQEKYPFGKPGTVSGKIADVLMSVEIPDKPRKIFLDMRG